MKKTEVEQKLIRRLMLKKMLNIMKLITFLILLAVMQVAAKGFSQSTNLTLELRGKTLSQVFSEIERNSEYSIFYKNELIENTKTKDVSCKDASVFDVLNSVLENEKLSYTVKGKLIMIVASDRASQSTKESQQGRVVKGLVTDSQKQPLPGVTVLLKGTGNGVVTDVNGNYSISDLENNSILVFSFVGMKTQEIKVGSHQTINIVLVEETIGLEEVVAVGYGTQKKLNLTGAVDHVNSKVFENRPLPNITRGLQGQIPNLNIVMGDGKPTRGATYNIRGATSIGAGGSALILIDGVPGNPNMLNPSDIESVSVLKDAASAAIYGARGSFGVVLITTRKPKSGNVQIKYSGSLSYNDRTVKPDLVTNGYEWAKTFDEAYASWNDYKTHPQKVNSVFKFSLDYLDELKRRQDDPSLPKVDIDPATGEYVYYGSTDWLKELYADVMPANQQSLVISGSKDKMSFYLSANYTAQGGIFRYSPDKYRMYNLRAKESMQVFDWLMLENDFSYSQMNYTNPFLNHSSDTPVWRRISDEAFPIAMLRNPDGTLTENASIVFGSFISGNNYQEYKKLDFTNTTRFTADLSKNLALKGDFTFKSSPNIETNLYTPVPYSKKPGVMTERGESKMKYWDQKNTYLGANLFAEYEFTTGKHSLKSILGYNYEYSVFDKIYLDRYGVINPELPDFSLIDGENFTMTGGGSEWRTIGGFFRVNYNYADRYLFEMNGRYDGSSKFPSQQQFGFFPSFSGAWRISEEPFWGNLQNRIQNVKLRASYGSLGNGNVAPYQFLETMSVSKSSVIINGSLPNKTQKPAVIPHSLTWEKVTSANFGLDFGLFHNRLTTTFDYYNRFTYGMFTTGTPLPSVFGATVPKGNYADLKTEGWELSIQWSDQIGAQKPFKYDLRVSLSDNVAEILDYNNPQKLINTYYKGSRVGEIWGFVTEGFFVDEADIASHANQSYVRVSAANKLLPGDIKFRDLNNDKYINLGKSTVDDPGDQKIIGNEMPRYNFGVNANAEWNNFFFSAFIQGIGKRDYWPGKDNSLFWGAYNRPYSFSPKDVVENMWSEENPDAYFPRLRGYVALNSRAELTLPQTRYLQNAAYIRLKNLTFGYSLPQDLVRKIGLSDFKIYFNGQNLWTYSPMFKVNRNLDPEVIDGSDPETAGDRGNGMRYPMLKTFTFGINVTI